MPFSISQSNSILNSNVRSGYIGLINGAPSDSSSSGVSFNELSGDGYARVSLSSFMGNASNKSITNTSIIYFPEAESSWGTATHFGIFTSKTGGSPIIYGSLTSSVSIPSESVPLFRVGQFKLSLT